MATPAESEVRMTELVMPTHTNNLGTLFGGQLVAWMDVCGSMAAMRHAGRQVVTAAIDSLTFAHPIRLGQAVGLTARVTWVGRTSMEVKVVAEGVDLPRGERWHTSTAYFTFVAVDEAGKPQPVPPLTLSTEEDKQEWRRAASRRKKRLRRREGVEL